jgi:hypothetical protein
LSRQFLVAVATAFALAAATPSAQEHQHQHVMNEESTWTFMHDGVIFGLFNHQGGPRGGDEFKGPNWWMGMASRKAGPGQLTLTGMISVDPATAGKAGYREIFQVGEVLDGRPLIDRQHPHDLFMQLAATWRTPIFGESALTLVGAPVGEPALGPVAFMHRPSAENIPLATLSHHTFDSTHISYGVITAAVDTGRWTFEASLFNGREPDDHRWDFDFGRLDSVSGRVWLRPAPNWELQLSTGHLVDPEELEPGNVQRTTASLSWFARETDNHFTAMTIGYGVNAAHGTMRHAVFTEATRHTGANSVSIRGELLQVERDLLVEDRIPDIVDGIEHRDPVGALTVGAARDIIHWKGLETSVGGNVTFYAVPAALQPTHGSHPVSFQLFVRVRPLQGGMGRMWNMRMGKSMHAERR